MNELTLDEAKYYKAFPEKMEAAGYTLDQVTAVIDGTSEVPPEQPETEEDRYNEWRRSQGLTVTETPAVPEFPIVDLEAKLEADKQRREREKTVSSADSLTKQDLYGERPSVSLLDKGKAFASDILNTVTGYEGDPTEKQQAVDELPAAVEVWEQEAQKLYNETGTEQPDGSRVYKEYIKNEETGKFDIKETLIPEYDSSFWSRIIVEGGKNFAKDMSGLSRGEITTDSDTYEVGTEEKDKNFNQRTPSLQLSGGEQILSDLWSVAVPMTGAMKITQGTLRGAKALATGNRAAKLGGFGTGVSNTIAGTIVETIAASDAQTGLAIKPEMVSALAESVGANFTPEGAKDLSVLLDGMLINGALDGLIAVSGPVWGFLRKSTSDTYNLANKQSLQKAVQEGVVLKAAAFLDPAMFAGKTAREASRSIKVLSRMLNQNQIINLKIGDLESGIPAPTTQAIGMGAEAYVRETRQHLADTMDADAFEAMVKKESDLVFKRMTTLLRSRSGDPAVAGQQAELLAEMGGFLSTAGDKMVATNLDDAAGATVGNLARQIEDEKAVLAADVEDAAGSLKAVDNALETVVPDDSSINLIIDDFESMALTGEAGKILSDWTQSTVYPVFKQMKEEVGAAYKAIPNDPIGPQAAEALFDTVLELVRKQNTLDESGKQAKDTLGEIFASLTKRKMTDKTIMQDLFGPNGSFVIDQMSVGLRPETKREFLERLGSTIGIQDVLNLRPTLKQMREGANPQVASRIDELRQHITDPYEGQLSFPSLETRAKALEADQLYKDFDNRWRSDDRITELAQKLDDQRGKEGLTKTDITTTDQGQVDSARAMGQYVDASKQETSGAGFVQLIEAIDMDVGNTGPTKGVMNDVIMADMAKQLATEAVSGMDDAGLKRLIAPHVERLRASGNSETADNLIAMVDGIKTKINDLGDQKAGAESALEAAQVALKGAQNSILKSLLSKTQLRSGGVVEVARTDARKALSDIITQSDGTGTKALLEEIDKLPTSQQMLARQSLQAVALDTLGSKVFGSSITSFKDGKPVRGISPSQIVKLDDNQTQGLMNTLDLIFPPNSGSPQTESVREGVITTLNKIYNASVPSFMRDVTQGSNTALASSVVADAKQAASTSILLLAGYMNPTAAMLRRLSNVPIEEALALEKQISAHVLAVIVTDPKGFANLLDATRKNARRETLDKIAMTALKTARNDGRYQIRIRDEDDDTVLGNQMAEIGFGGKGPGMLLDLFTESPVRRGYEAQQ